MDDQATEFTTLIERVRQGSQEAARELADTYGPHVQRYARRVLHRDMRNRFDSLDFVQLVWVSFFCDQENLPPLHTPAQLVAYLAAMVQNKVVDEGRRQHTLKHDTHREIRIDGPKDIPQRPIPSRDPTPSAVAIAQEQFDTLVKGQPSYVGKVLQLRCAGATFREIAEELNIHERTARRTISKLERQMTVEAEPSEIEES
jgi:RNA polymerase sigma factor (sigma-70 family)